MVAPYCRVSTDNKDQLASYELQCQYYKEYVSKHPGWRLYDIYADEGISGTSVKKRTDFLRMIDDCKAGKIDMIIVKNIARFARNVVDCVATVRKSKLTPIVYGGSEQEFGLRGGTENVAGIVGFGKACEISSKSLHEDTVWVSTLKQRFFMALNEALKDTGDESCVHVNGMSILTPGKTINLRMDGVDGETLLLMLDGKGVCVSAGSACRSHEAEPSHVLSAMGLSKDEARSSIRISFSKKNTADEAVRAAQILAGCISALRAREEKE